MTATGWRIAHWGIRFVVAAAIYVATATVWVQQAQGWASLGQFIAALVFGGFAAVSWWIVTTISQLAIRRAGIRLLAHPLLTAALFAFTAIVIVYGLWGGTAEEAWRDAKPFIALVAGCAAADALVGYLLERAIISQPARS